MNEWISIKDRPPEVDKPVLAIGICNKTGEYYYGWLKRKKNGELRAAVMDDVDIDPDDTIACKWWMPLPEPPKEIKDE